MQMKLAKVWTITVAESMKILKIDRSRQKGRIFPNEVLLVSFLFDFRLSRYHRRKRAEFFRQLPVLVRTSRSLRVTNQSRLRRYCAGQWQTASASFLLLSLPPSVSVSWGGCRSGLCFGRAIHSFVPLCSACIFGTDWDIDANYQGRSFDYFFFWLKRQ